MSRKMENYCCQRSNQSLEKESLVKIKECNTKINNDMRQRGPDNVHVIDLLFAFWKSHDPRTFQSSGVKERTSLKVDYTRFCENNGT